MLANGLGQFLECRAVEDDSGLFGIGRDAVERDHPQSAAVLAARGGIEDVGGNEGGQTATEDGAAHDATFRLPAEDPGAADASPGAAFSPMRSSTSSANSW